MMRIKDYNNRIVEVEDKTFTIFGCVDNLNIESSKDFNIPIGYDIWITNDFKYIKFVSIDNITNAHT